MNDQVFSGLRELPRQNLEDLALQVMIEMREHRREAAPNSYFMAVLSGFLLGAASAGAGFLAGTMLR